MVSVLPVLVALAAAGMITHGVIGGVRARRLQRRADTVVRATVLALDTIALEMRSGAYPQQALRAAERAHGVDLPGLAAAASETDPLAAAQHLRDGSPELRGLGAALRLSSTSGASLADLCERLAVAAAAQEAAARELSDGLAGARSTATLLTALPVGGIVLAAAAGANPLPLLLGGGPLGSACLLAGVGLLRAGQLWTWRLVCRASTMATG